jgi:hypothetical protein
MFLFRQITLLPPVKIGSHFKMFHVTEYRNIVGIIRA